MLLIRPLNSWGFLRDNWYCYQAIVEDLFYSTQRPGRVRSQVKNPDPVPSVCREVNLHPMCGSRTFWEVELRQSGEILHHDWLVWVSLNHLIGKLRSMIGSKPTSFTNLSHHIWSSGLRTEPTDFMTGLFLLSLSVFGWQFVKWLALCSWAVVCPVLSVCDVGVLWPNGWMDQGATCYGGRPWHRPHCVRWDPVPP